MSLSLASYISLFCISQPESPILHPGHLASYTKCTYSHDLAAHRPRTAQCALDVQTLHSDVGGFLHRGGPSRLWNQLLTLCSLLEPSAPVPGFIKNAGRFPSIFPQRIGFLSSFLQPAVYLMYYFNPFFYCTYMRTPCLSAISRHTSYPP